jgi:IS30 family transposase
LRDEVEAMLDEKNSPEQIAGRLKQNYPYDPTMHLSHETIYKELYIQTRGGLKKELLSSLRRGHTMRQPHRPQRIRPGVVKDMIMIADRPVEVAERVIPGHWEGDLIMGPQNQSAIGVLVERVSNLVLLLPLPNGHTAELVASAVIDAFTGLPDHLCRSLTWDQGSEMARHHLIRMSTGVEVYFCDPHSPWQRATNENTNGLLRQYFPKGKNLKHYQLDYIRFVEAQMNDRPRKRLGFQTPAEVFQQLLLDPTKTIHDALTH